MPTGLQYRIIGSEIQALDICLAPSEKVIAEKGSVIAMEEGVEMSLRVAGATEGQGMLQKLWGVGKRMIGGEKFFMLEFENTSAKETHVMFASPALGQIIPIEIRPECPLLCQRTTFLCTTENVAVTMGFHKNIGAVIFAGASFILQRLVGEGTAFIQASGTIIKRELEAGEKLRVDPACLVALEDTVSFNLETTGGAMTMAFGGEGIVFSVLTGPGTIWLQSLPFGRLQERILSPLVEALKDAKVVK